MLWQVVKFLFWYLVLGPDFLALLSTSFFPFGLNKNLFKYKILRYNENVMSSPASLRLLFL